MNHYRLISSILRGPFMIEESFALSFLPAVDRLLAGEPANFYSHLRPNASFADGIIEENAEANADYVLVPHGDRWKPARNADEILPGSIYMMQLDGAVMKDDFCGVPGTRSLGAMITKATSHPNIAAAVFKVDSGGGHVDGTFEFCDILAGIEKPVVGYVDGSGYSAAYAMMSVTDHIMLSHETAGVGSIGTATQFMDYQKYFKKKGFKRHYVTSRQSPDKNKDILSALDGDYTLLQDQLDAYNKIFINTVKRSRKEVSSDALTGKTFIGSQAIEMGLADSIGSLGDAVNKAMELFTSNQ